MVFVIEKELNLIKEVVDNSSHVIIDEDNLFNYIKENKQNIKNETKSKENMKNIIKKLIELKIIKYDNSKTEETETELEAAAKLIIYLIQIEIKLPYTKIISYLSS